MTRKTSTSLLRIAAVLLVAGAGVTLTPHSGKTVSDLGYHTLCPFAPWSTLTLLFLAWLAWTVRGYINQQPV